MHAFLDAAGHTWSATVNTNAIKRAKDTAGIYLVDIMDGDLYGRLLRDPVLVVDVAWGVCQPEAQTRKVTREDFNAVLTGDAIAAARQAILEDLVDFFPNPVRDMLKGALARTAARPAPSAPGPSSGNSPALSASTPAT